jgi:Mycoplasma protein of unknown function, DUF285
VAGEDIRHLHLLRPASTGSMPTGESTSETGQHDLGMQKGIHNDPLHLANENNDDHSDDNMSTLTEESAFFSQFSKRARWSCCLLACLAVLVSIAVASICGAGFCDSRSTTARHSSMGSSNQQLGSRTTTYPTRSPVHAPALPTTQPRSAGKVFETTQELYAAVDAYVLDPLNATSLVAQTYGHPIGTWRVQQLADFSRVFDGQRNPALQQSFAYAEALNWDTARATTMEFMFRDAAGVDPIVTGFDTGRVTNMDEMFARAISFRGRGIENWNVERVITMAGMCTYFNHPILACEYV